MANQRISNNGKEVAVAVDVFLAKDGKFWIAYCPALNLSSYGDTKEDAKQAFDEAVHIFIKDTKAKGTLEKVLLGLGWTLQQQPRPIYDPPTYTQNQVREQLHLKPTSINIERVNFPITPAMC